MLMFKLPRETPRSRLPMILRNRRRVFHGFARVFARTPLFPQALSLSELQTPSAAVSARPCAPAIKPGSPPARTRSP